MKGYHIAVVGATGAAGTELLRVLERRNFPVASLRLIGSKRSAGKSVRFREEPISVQELDDRSFDKIDIAFFSAGGDVSGSGARGIEELKRQVAGKDLQPSPELYPHPIAFNLLPHIDAFLESGYTKEEAKMQGEAQKIMHLPELRISATCVRVPVYRAHSVAVSAEFERVISVEQAREVLAKARGLELVDEPQSNRYPMPLSVAGKDNCQVGRVRLDCAFENGLSFWVSGDQLLKGAALNAGPIAELL